MKRTTHWLVLITLAACISIPINFFRPTQFPNTFAHAQTVTVNVSLPVEARVLLSNNLMHIGQLISVNAAERQLMIQGDYEKIPVSMDEVERIEFPQNSLAYDSPGEVLRGESARVEVGDATWGPIPLSSLSVTDPSWGLARIAGVSGVELSNDSSYVIDTIEFDHSQSTMTVHVLIYQ